MSRSESSPNQQQSAARDAVRQKLVHYLAEVIPGCSDVTVKLSEEALKAGDAARAGALIARSEEVTPKAR